MFRLTKAELAALNPCDPTRQMALFGRRKAMTAAQAIDAGASIDDLLWVAGRLGLKTQCVRFALACARRAAHMGSDLNGDSILGAVAAWVDDPSEPNRHAIRSPLGSLNGLWGVKAAITAAAGSASIQGAPWSAAWASRAARGAVEAAWSSGASRVSEVEIQTAIFLEIFGKAER